MKKLFVVAWIALGATLAMAPAEARAGCSPIGTWAGTYFPETTLPVQWMSVYSGQSESSGTYVLNLWDFDPTLGSPYLADAVAITPVRGTWERVGGNKIAGTSIGFALDAKGKVVWAAKMWGVATLSSDCNTVTLELFLGFMGPDQDPLAPADEITWMVPPAAQPIHYGHRLAMEPSVLKRRAK